MIFCCELLGKKGFSCTLRPVEADFFNKITFCRLRDKIPVTKRVCKYFRRCDRHLDSFHIEKNMLDPETCREDFSVGLRAHDKIDVGKSSPQECSPGWYSFLICPGFII